MLHEKRKSFLFFILPSLLGFLVLYLIPFVWGAKFSFCQSGFSNEFVGLRNYIDVLSSSAFRLAVKNTGIFMGLAIPLIMLLSFILALALYETNLPKTAYLCLIMPIAVPSATVAGFFRKLIGTGMNSFLNSEYALLGVILIFLWKNTGYNLIIFVSGLMQLDTSTLEAGKIDGADYWQRLRCIVIPQCTPAAVLAAIVSVVNSFKVFKDIYILQGSYPNPRIYMLQHYMNNKFVDIQYEKLTSAACLFAAVIFAFAFLMFSIDRRYGKKVGEV